MTIVPSKCTGVKVSVDLRLSLCVKLLINLALSLIEHNMDLLSDLCRELQNRLAINFGRLCAPKADGLD